MSSARSNTTSERSKPKVINSQLLSKISNLESRYNEFVSNCSSYLGSPHTRPTFEKKIPTDRLNEKRGKSSELCNQNIVLKRQNGILTKTVEELNKKIVSLESISDESALNKEFSQKIQQKARFLEKQEGDLAKLKHDLEKSKNEVAMLKNNYTEREKTSRGNTQGLKKHSKSPTSLRFYPKTRDYSPIDRKSPISPAHRHVSPHDRASSTLKKKMQNIQEKLVKTREERDLFKNWKDYCLKNPPLPPAVNIIVNQYESEINKLNLLNAVLKSNTDRLVKTVKDLVTELNRCSGLRNNQVLENLKMKITDTIRQIQSVKCEGISPLQKPELNLSLVKKSHKMYEKENKDLEDIVRREQFRADYVSDELDAKTIENLELRQTIESFHFSGNYNSHSAPITTENFFDNKAQIKAEFGYSSEEFNRIFAEFGKIEGGILEKFSRVNEKLWTKIGGIERVLGKVDEWKRKCREFIEKGKKQDRILVEFREDNLYLRGKTEEYEGDIYEKTEIIEKITAKIQNLEQENKCLNGAIVSLEQKLLESTGKVISLPIEKPIVSMSIVFENSFTISEFSKESDHKKIIELLNKMLNEEINLSNISLIENRLNEAKTVKEKYLDALKNYMDLKNDHDNLENLVKNMKIQHESLQSSLKSAQSQYEALQNAFEISNSHKSELDSLAKSLQTQLIATENLLSSQTSQLQNSKASQEKLELEFSEKLNLAIEEKKKLIEIIQVLSKESKEYQNSATEIQKELNQTIQKNLDLKKQNENLKENFEIENNVTEVKDLELLNANLQKISEVQELKIGKKSKKIANLSMIISQMQEEINILKNEAKRAEELLHKKIPEFSICFLYSLTIIRNKVAVVLSIEQGEMSAVFGEPVLLSPHMRNSSLSQGSLTQSPRNILRLESLEEMAEVVQSQDISFSNSFFSLQAELNSSVTLKPEQLGLDKLLEEIELLIQNEIPDKLIDWCKIILNNQNYILRYQSNDSITSEESHSNIDEISIVSEIGSQEINYKSHLKLSQMKKMIENLSARLKVKKERIKVSKSHIKTLQNEIRTLDSKIKNESSLDLQYLKTTILSFAKKLKKLDKDSMVMLQIIFSQLGLNIEEIHEKDDKKRWGLFSRK